MFDRLNILNKNCVVFKKNEANQIPNKYFLEYYYLKAGQRLNIFFSDKKPPKKQKKFRAEWRSQQVYRPIHCITW